MGSMTEGELLNKIYAAISRGEDLAEIIRIAAEGARSLFSGNNATVYFLDEEQLHLIPQNWGLPEGLTRKLEEMVGFKVRGLQFPVVEGGHYWQTIHEQRTFCLTTSKEIQGLIGELASDHRALKKLVPSISRFLGYRTVLTAPLVAGGDVVGVVDVGSRKLLEDEALERFERLANSLSVAISSARLLEQISASERLYRAVVESSADAIICLTPDLRVTSWSKGAEDIFGYSHEEIFGQLCSILFPEEDRERTAQVFERVRSEGFVRGFRTQRLARDGHSVDVEVTITSLVKDMGFTTVMRDITERKRSQELTLHLNLVLRALREVNQLITNEHDRDRLLQQAVKIIIETRGYYSAWIVLCDEKRDPHSMFSAGLGKEANLLEELLSREEVPVCAQRALSQPGVVAILDQASECDGCPLIGKLPEHREMTACLEHQGTVYGFISVAVPLKYLNEAEEEDLFSELAGDIAYALYRLRLEEENTQFLKTLQESEERFRLIVENAHSGIIIVDEQYHSVWVNNVFCDILGRERSEIIGRDFREFLDDESRQLVADRYVRRQCGEEVPFKYEFDVVRKNGTKRRVEIHSAIVTDRAGRIRTIAQLLDITERVRAREDLQDENQMVLALSRSAASVVRELDSGVVLDHVLEGLQNVVDADAGSMMLVDGDVARIVGARIYRESVPQYDILGEKFSIPDTPNIRRIMETQAPVVVFDTNADPDWLRLPWQEWLASWAGVPIAIRGKVIGILNADRTKVGGFNQKEIERMQVFANIAAAAIDNARLLEETKRRAEQRAVLVDLGRSLASILDLHSIYRTAYEYVNRVVDCDSFAISMFDKQAATLSAGFLLSDGEEIDISQLPPLKNDPKSMTGRAGTINLRRTLIVDDLADKAKKSNQVVHVESDEEPQSAIYVPMIVEDDIIGLVEVQSHKRHAYSEDDVPILSMAANQIALAIHNQSLFARISGLKTFNERIVTSLNEGVVLEDVSGVITYVNRAASELLEYSPGELTGMHWWEIIPEKVREAIVKKMESRKAGESERYETLLLTKSGKELPVIVSARPLFDEDSFSGVISVITDIRDRKQAEERTKRAFEGLIEALELTTESRDAYTAGHQRHVTSLAVAIAREMEIPGNRVEGLRIAGMVHDIGKIAVPAEILSKPTHLSDIETEMIRTHSEVAYDILKGIDFPWPIAKIVLQHHERMDGSGYPRGLKGEDIMLEARIIAVADVVEAMSSHRPYRPALGIDVALQEITENKGTKYDQDVVDACIAVFENGFAFD